MSMGLRGFTEYLEKKIREEGVLGSQYDQSEVENDVVKMIWDAYEEWNSEE